MTDDERARRVAEIRARLEKPGYLPSKLRYENHFEVNGIHALLAALDAAEARAAEAERELAAYMHHGRRLAINEAIAVVERLCDADVRELLCPKLRALRDRK